MFVTPRPVSRSRVPWMDTALTTAMGRTPTTSSAATVLCQNLNRNAFLPTPEAQDCRLSRSPSGRGRDAMGTGGSPVLSAWAGRSSSASVAPDVARRAGATGRSPRPGDPLALAAFRLPQTLDPADRFQAPGPRG